MNLSESDVIIVGGGPAGATTAAILLRHRPETRVRIIEHHAFPRFHVGETLVAEINLILDEMGAYEAVSQAGFIRKYGATFRWGASPEPWHLLFATMDELRPAEKKVQTAFTWHVDRAPYDQILLETAVKAGAEVTHARVSELVEESGRVVGVRTDQGEFRARFVVDATGQAGLAGSASHRVMDPSLRNIAYWGYYKGFKFEQELNGSWDQSRAFIVAHPHGWSWYFPIRPDLLSVGVVTRLADSPAGQSRNPEAYFRQAVESCPELARLLADATLVPYDESAPLVHVVRDYSYISSEVVRPGLARVGDAAGFIDPILSVGCFLGQSGGRHLAYALRSVLDGTMEESLAIGAYADHVTEILHAFREVTWFFYRFNERKDAWWAQARRLVADGGFPASASDRHAFSAFASGFAGRRSVFREPNGVFGEPFFADAFRRLVDPSGIPAAPDFKVSAQSRPRIRGRVECRPSAIPVDGGGRVVPALRVEVHTVEERGGDTLIRRMFVPPTMERLFEWLDGSHDLGDIVARLERHLGTGTAERPAILKYVRGVIEGLHERGLLTV